MADPMADPGLFDIMYSTRSMRRLKPDPIPDEVLKKIVDAGVHASSGSNFQSWAFLLIKDPETKRFIRDHYLHAYEELARRGSIPAMADLPPYKQRMFDAAVHLAQHLDEVPVILLACSGTEFPTYAGADNPRAITATLHASIYPAVQNILLACRALGVGATLTTVHYFFEEELKQKLGVPADMEITALLPLGFPEGRFGPVSRRPVEEALHWDRWGNRKE
jgi:nitroreductase